jgi:hypothetical protein
MLNHRWRELAMVATGSTSSQHNNSHNRWEKLTVDSLGLLFKFISVVLVMIVCAYVAKVSVWAANDFCKLPSEVGRYGAASCSDTLVIAVGWLFVASWLQAIGLAIDRGRKRFAQSIFSGCFFILATGSWFWYVPLLIPSIAEDLGMPAWFVEQGTKRMTVWTRFVGGLGGSLYFAASFLNRWRADREAESKVAVDAEEYSKIFSDICSHDGAIVHKLKVQNHR